MSVSELAAPLGSPPLHVVMFSGGACSWLTAKRVVERHGTKGVVLLFADTMMEDEDLYRFIVEAAENVGVPLTRISDGRTPWQVFEKEKMIGNTRMDPCSKILKRQLLDKWHKKNCDPAITTLHFGLDWTETHRLERLRVRKAPWKVEGYASEAPRLMKEEMINLLLAEGIRPPRLYAMGFKHNNCGGFCVKAGQAQFALLLRTMPERYRFHEENEERLRAKLGWRHTILRIQSEGKTRGISLREFRERIEKQPTFFDAFDWGGCGCAVDDGPASVANTVLSHEGSALDSATPPTTSLP
jgi:hypothetical protein